MLDFLTRRSGGAPTASGLRMSWGAFSVEGRSRSVNQDSWGVDTEIQTLVVADGIGGGVCGEIASEMASEYILHGMQQQSDGSELSAADQMKDAFALAAKAIRSSAASRECRCMGTTAVCATLQNRELTIGWVGDSRAYLIRDGAAQLLTHDQSIAQALCDSGAIPAEAVATHAFRNTLWNFLGVGDVTGVPETTAVSLQPGDTLILATDGVTGPLHEEDLLQIVTPCMSPRVAAERCVRAALDAGTLDDATCVVAFVEEP